MTKLSWFVTLLGVVASKATVTDARLQNYIGDAEICANVGGTQVKVIIRVEEGDESNGN